MKPEINSFASVILLGFLQVITRGWSLNDCNKSMIAVLNCSGVGDTDIPTIWTGTNRSYDFKILDFSNNNITRLSRLNISSENNVSKISFSNNHINAIDSGAFEEMTKLNELDLSVNNLEGVKLDAKQFINAFDIKKLNMSRNPIRVIRKDVFSIVSFNLLEQLDLSHCQINSIEDDAFDLHRLKALDLSWNDLSVLQEGAFNRLIRLVSLNLSHNKLKVLAELPELTTVKQLKFDYNQITSVSVRKSMEDRTEMLEQLYIRNNRIMRFTEEGFYWDLDFLQGIFLDNNPICCDCEMKWIVADEKIRNRNFTITCDSPTVHRGKNLLTIPAEQLVCTQHLMHTRLLKGSFIFIAMLAIMFAFCLSFHRTLRRKWRRMRSQRKRSRQYGGANYTSVYTKEGEELRIYDARYEKLVSDGQEFDV